MTSVEAARGFRLNNPGDIIASAVKYLGEMTPSSDPRFKEFQSPAFGLRAIIEILEAYILHDGIKTLGDALARYAPPSENDTENYTAAICADCQATAETPFTLAWLRSHVRELVRAIVVHEIGAFPYPDTTLELAVTLAMDTEG